MCIAESYANARPLFQKRSTAQTPRKALIFRTAANLRTIVQTPDILGECSERLSPIPAFSHVPADPLDAAIAQDLKETLAAHREECVGMAANMIGEPKRVIAFVDEGLGSAITVMFNPQITAADGEYDACEGCLSLHGERHTPRFRRIEVDYTTRKGRARHATFTDWTAQIIQHEIDHCNGVLI